MFASLHNHSFSSNIRFLDSINRPEDMVEKAISLGFSAIAFTDHESLSAAVSILKIKDKIKDKNPDFKIIFGNEIYLIDDADVHSMDLDKKVQYYHFILLAKDEEGWQQLKTLSSRAWSRGYVERGIMRVPTTYKDIEEVIKPNQGHIFASTACLGGELPVKILAHDVTGANNFTKWCISTFGRDNFAFELQPSDTEEQITVNKTLIKFAKHYNIPYIITTDSHYLNKEDFKIHSAFLNSKQSSDRETDKFYRFTYIMSEDEMKDILLKQGLSEEEIKEGLDNTVKISNQIVDYDFRHSTIVPALHLPKFELKHLLKDVYDKYPMIKQYAYSSSEQDQFLMYQIENGLISKNVVIDDVKLQRINDELDVVAFISNRLQQDVSAYLNLAVDMINLAWQVSLVGCGRGSACGFYINYLIGITQCDPLVYGLPYWRFLNKERVEMPDIDSDYQPEKTPEIIQIFRDAYGDDNVLNCATFKTESLKSAILTCGRGLGYNNDEMQALAALVPSHRGITYNLEQCVNGDEEKDLDPVPGFLDKFDPYPGLLEAVRKIEGMPTNSSIHASALYIFNNGYLEHNSLMRAPNGTKMTAFNMHDSDDQGALKMDVLRTDAQSKMAKCLDLLIKNKQIEWQGSLRKTYDKYLHPDVLDYTNPKMWEKAASGEIANLFQFETQVGSVCIKKAKPENVMQLAEINSIMRLQVEGDEQPIDRYVKFRNDINLWYLEMIEIGLNSEEIQVLEKYLKESFGISGSQEKLMLLVMDPKISNFTLGEANGFRKAISKKIAAKIQENKEKYFKKGHDLGTRDVFLNYVWKYCVEPQLGYAFSLNHTLPYSVIAVQEMNLATRWNPLYWQCACLCINAGNSDTDFDLEDEEEDTEVVEETSNEEEITTTAKRSAPKYGKIAKAISDAQLSGVNIELPDINTSQIDFSPDIENNSILYSLSAINVVNTELAERIIAGRPYTSITDFEERIQPTQAQMVGLIKAGCFDKLENKKRDVIMLRYVQKLAEEECPLKDKLTSVQLKKALELGLSLQGFDTEIRLFKYKRYIDKNRFDAANKRYVFNDEACIKFFRTFIEQKLKIEKSEYGYIGDKIFMKKSAFDKVYNESMATLMGHINTLEGRKAYQDLLQKDFINKFKEKYYGIGDLSSWEMETMNFYHGRHELADMNDITYNTRNFNELPEYPEEDGGKNKYKLCTLAGTVTDYDNSRHTISLLTKYGVVDVKMYAGLYTQFNQKISKLDPATKKKVVIDESFFKRGTKLIVYGYRKENMFSVKTDYSSGFKRSIGLIESIRDDGSLSVRYSRKKN